MQGASKVCPREVPSRGRPSGLPLYSRKDAGLDWLSETYLKKSDQDSYFVGRIAPFLMFEYEYHCLDHVVSTFDEKPDFQKSNPAEEACLIGVVAHFEAFCKHLFAASSNLRKL